MFGKNFRFKEGQRFSGTIWETMEIRLSVASLVRIEGDGRGLEILGRTGILWITQEKDLQDYFLRARERFKIDRPGLVIVYALENAEFKIIKNVEGWKSSRNRMGRFL